MRVQGESKPPDHVQKLSVDVDGFSENILHCGSILYVYFLMLGVTLREHILEFAEYSIRRNAVRWVAEHKCFRIKREVLSCSCQIIPEEGHANDH